MKISGQLQTTEQIKRWYSSGRYLQQTVLGLMHMWGHLHQRD